MMPALARPEAACAAGSSAGPDGWLLSSAELAPRCDVSPGSACFSAGPAPAALGRRNGGRTRDWACRARRAQIALADARGGMAAHRAAHRGHGAGGATDPPAARTSWAPLAVIPAWTQAGQGDRDPPGAATGIRVAGRRREGAWRDARRGDGRGGPDEVRFSGAQDGPQAGPSSDQEEARGRGGWRAGGAAAASGRAAGNRATSTFGATRGGSWGSSEAGAWLERCTWRPTSDAPRSAAPTVKQHLVAIRMPGNWPSVNQVTIAAEPPRPYGGRQARGTKGATYRCSRPRTARRLLDAIDAGTLAGLRRTGRNSTASRAMRRFIASGCRTTRRRAGGGVIHAGPSSVTAGRAGLPGTTIAAAGRWTTSLDSARLDEAKAALFQSVEPRWAEADGPGAVRRPLAMIKRRRGSDLPPSTCPHPGQRGSRRICRGVRSCAADRRPCVAQGGSSTTGRRTRCVDERIVI